MRIITLGKFPDVLSISVKFLQEDFWTSLIVNEEKTYACISSGQNSPIARECSLLHLCSLFGNDVIHLSLVALSYS